MARKKRTIGSSQPETVMLRLKTNHYVNGTFTREGKTFPFSPSVAKHLLATTQLWETV